VHVQVRFNERVDCPFCRRLRPMIERVCRRVGVPLISREATVSPHIFGDDELRHVFAERNVRRLAPTVWREAENDPAARDFLRMHARSIHTPVTVIEAFPERGPALRFTIWEAPPVEVMEQCERALEAFLRALKSGEAV
jgi:hypothetical protein